MAPDYTPDLVTLVDGGELESSKWPQLLGYITSRIEDISIREFPTPQIPLPESATSNEEATRTEQSSPEALEPPEKKIKTDADTGAVEEASEDVASDARPDAAISVGGLPTPPPNTLPPQLYTLIRTIQATLRTSFPTSPPHTSQRLAELVLYPRKHYRSLPSYLRALDRIVAVASPNSAFPLILGQSNSNDTPTMFNGTASPTQGANDRDFIGGAELTPIPWLRDSNPASPTLHPKSAENLHTESTSVIDGPNGAGSVETVTVSMNGVPSATASTTQGTEDQGIQGVTQGELIRQEQEAGIAPVPMARASRSAAVRDQGTGTSDDMDTRENEEDETVHARGPNVIGMEDMGPQARGSGLEKGIELEGPVINAKRGEPAEASEEDSRTRGDGQVDEGAKAEDEAKTVLADVDGAEEGEKAAGGGVEKGADAADSTAR